MSFGVGSLLRYGDFQQVGEGTYGHVYRARDKQHQSQQGECMGAGLVALKRLILPTSKELAGFPVFALREISLLKRLRHPNVVSLLDIVSSKGCENVEGEIKTETLKLEAAHCRPATVLLDVQRCGSTFLVFEYIEHDLSGLIDARYCFSAVQVQFLALQLTRALAFLQERRVMHRDIKSSNVLVTNSLALKLADFGMARQVREGSELALLQTGRGVSNGTGFHRHSTAEQLREGFTNNVVTLWYRPPELLLGETHYLWNAVDVWSAGCVLAELELLRPLFPGKTVPEQLALVTGVMGVPSEATWQGVSALPHFATLLQQRDRGSPPPRSLSFRTMFEELISEDLLSFLDRLLVLDPIKRLSPLVALQSNMYLQSCKEKDVPPLSLEAGHGSFHEFETKRSMREKRDAEKKAKIQRLESEWSETAAGPGAGSQGTSEHALKKMRGS